MKCTYFFKLLSLLLLSEASREFRKSYVADFLPKSTIRAESAVKWCRLYLPQKVLKYLSQLLCSLFCASEIGCYSYSFEDGICQLGAFHGSPVGQSSDADKKCYVDAKGGRFKL